MNRVFAVVFAVALIGLVIVQAATEQNHPAESFEKSTLVLNLVAQVLLAFGMLLYCGFAALHSTQHVSSPHDRTGWLIATVFLNVLGSCWYYLTTYQSFRKIGKGRLMSFRNEKRV